MEPYGSELSTIDRGSTQRDDLTTLALQVVPHDQPRRRAGWPKELNVAVDRALAAEQVRPPDGVLWTDWDRVLAARRAENARPVEELRHLGPALEADQVLLTIDEVLTRKPEAGHFLELRTARMMTEHGFGYLSGVGIAFLQHLQLALLLGLGPLFALPGNVYEASSNAGLVQCNRACG